MHLDDARRGKRLLDLRLEALEKELELVGGFGAPP
jgi:hypothetical protein